MLNDAGLLIVGLLDQERNVLNAGRGARILLLRLPGRGRERDRYRGNSRCDNSGHDVPLRRPKPNATDNGMRAQLRRVKGSGGPYSSG